MRADDPPRFRFMRLRGRAAAGSEITDVVALLRTRFPKGRLVRKPAERMEYKDRTDKKRAPSAELFFLLRFNILHFFVFGSFFNRLVCLNIFFVVSLLVHFFFYFLFKFVVFLINFIFLRLFVVILNILSFGFFHL